MVQSKSTELYNMGGEHMRLYLEVPYNEKESLKRMALSAGWDRDRKQWYVSQKADYKKVTQWIPNSKNRQLLICDHIFIVEGMHKCDKCKKMVPVICFGLEDFYTIKQTGQSLYLSREKKQPGEITLAVFPSKISASFKKYLKEQYHFYWDYSKTARRRYFANHCSECGQIIGDFFLFVSRKDSPFHLCTQSKKDGLRLRRIELSEDDLSSLSLLHDENDTQQYILHMEYPDLCDFAANFIPSDKVNVEDVKDFKIKGSDI